MNGEEKADHSAMLKHLKTILFPELNWWGNSLKNTSCSLFSILRYKLIVNCYHREMDMQEKPNCQFITLPLVILSLE
jgi:hypothetical protein